MSVPSVMLSYSDFATTPSVACNIVAALRHAKETGARGLIFPQDEYHLTREGADQAFLTMSNHGDPGIKPIAFLLCGMRDFVLDGGGSTFVLDEIMQAVALLECENVILQNLSFLSRKTQNAEADILCAQENVMEIVLTHGTPHFVRDGRLMLGEVEGMGLDAPAEAFYLDEYDGESGWFVSGSAEYFLYTPDHSLAPHVTVTPTARGTLRLEGLRRPFTAGNRLVIGTESRCVSSLFLRNCKACTVRNVTLYNGIGMGLIAQGCDGLEVDRLSTRIRPGHLCSTGSDATHFVHCNGKLHLHDCVFEGQQDDAINVHSIYLKIVEKKEHSAVVRYMHPESRGIGIFFPGSRAAVIDPITLLSRAELPVADVKVLELDRCEIFFDADADLSVICDGDCLHEVSYRPRVIFERNRISNNRARGMILDGGADYIIRDNYVETPGPAVRFGGEASYWFETCGGETVLLENNTFVRPAYAGWGTEAIGCRAWEKGSGEIFLRGALTVRNNVFCDGVRPLAVLYGFASVTVAGNRFVNYPDPSVRCVACGDVGLQDIRTAKTQ